MLEMQSLGQWAGPKGRGWREGGGGMIYVARIKAKVKAVAIKTSERAIRLHCQRETEREEGERETCKLMLLLINIVCNGNSRDWQEREGGLGRV